MRIRSARHPTRASAAADRSAWTRTLLASATLRASTTATVVPIFWTTATPVRAGVTQPMTRRGPVSATRPVPISAIVAPTTAPSAEVPAVRHLICVLSVSPVEIDS